MGKELRGMSTVSISLNILNKNTLGLLMTELENTDNLIVRKLDQVGMLRLYSHYSGILANAMRAIQPHYKGKQAI